MELLISLYMPFCGSFLFKQSGKAEGEIKAPSSFHQYKISLSYWYDGTRKHGFMHLPPYPQQTKTKHLSCFCRGSAAFYFSIKFILPFNRPSAAICVTQLPLFTLLPSALCLLPLYLTRLSSKHYSSFSVKWPNFLYFSYMVSYFRAFSGSGLYSFSNPCPIFFWASSTLG